MRFPVVESESLSGAAFVAPADFVGSPTIALVAFDLAQRAELETWLPFVDALVRAGTARGRVFAVLAHSLKLMKAMIVSTMRSAAPGPDVRAATVPLFVDIDAFCAELGIGDRTVIAVLLIQPDGSISVHRSGAFSTAAGDAIVAGLAR
jgi:hypothetical protein